MENLFHVLKHGKKECGSYPCYATIDMAANDGAVTLNYGRFIQKVINFLLSGLFMFVLIKIVESLKRNHKEVAEEEFNCPFCFKPINLKAVRCPFCTSTLKYVP
jgi:large conductance mechanosensitive channel